MQGQYGYPLFAPLTVPDHDVMKGNVHILHPLADALHQPEAKAVEQTCHYP